MIKKLEKYQGYFENINENYLKSLEDELDTYINKYVVLLNEMTCKDSNDNIYSLSKGTLVKLHICIKPVSFTIDKDGYGDNIYYIHSIEMSGVIDNSIKSFSVFKNEESVLLNEIMSHIKEDIDPEIISAIELSAYSCEKCLNFIDETFGSAEEIDTICKPLKQLSKPKYNPKKFYIFSTCTLVLGFIISIIFIDSCSSMPLISSPIGKIGFSIVIIGMILGILSCVFEIKNANNDKLYLNTWQEIDKQITEIVEKIDSIKAQKQIEQQKLQLNMFNITNMLKDTVK